MLIRKLRLTHKARRFYSDTMSKPVVFVTRDDFPSIVQELLQKKFDVKCWFGEKPIPREILKENVKGAFGIYCSLQDKIDSDIIKAAGENLKVVATYSVGHDHLNIRDLKSAGIRIGYTPDVLTEATAELGIAILLAVSRHVVYGALTVQRGEWASIPYTPMGMCGYGLENATVGIVGCGRIGLSVARKIKSFNIGRLLYFSRKEKSEVVAFGGVLKSINDLIKESDFVIVTLAQTEETKGIINRERINSMKSNAILVNIGRGGLIDQDALTEALRNKKIAGAALDVTSPEPLDADHPLLKLNNVVITPHIGSATYSARREMGALAANNIIAVFEGKEMPAEVK